MISMDMFLFLAKIEQLSTVAYSQNGLVNFLFGHFLFNSCFNSVLKRASNNLVCYTSYDSKMKATTELLNKLFNINNVVGKSPIKICFT